MRVPCGGTLGAVVQGFAGACIPSGSLESSVFSFLRSYMHVPSQSLALIICQWDSLRLPLDSANRRAL